MLRENNIPLLQAGTESINKLIALRSRRMSLSHSHALRQLPDVNAADSNVLWSTSTAESEGHQNRRLLQPFFTGFF